MDTQTVSAPIELLPLPSAAVLAYVAKWGAGALYVLSQPIGFPVQLWCLPGLRRCTDGRAGELEQCLRSAAPGALLVGTRMRACQEIMKSRSATTCGGPRRLAQGSP